MEPTPKRILVADDDLEIRVVISDILEGDGFEIHCCASGNRALDRLREGGFDLALVDIRMPGMTGIEVLLRARELSLDTRIILMTAYASLETAVEALRGEAFDYLIKPFSPKEVRRRVEEALVPPQRRGRGRGIRYYQSLAVDRTARRVWMEGREINLTRLEFDLLDYLLERQGQAVSCEELLTEVWGAEEAGECNADAVKACVWRLRRKIGDDAQPPSYIVNEWGVGYQLGY